MLLYNNSFRILNNLPMRGSIRDMFTTANVFMGKAIKASFESLMNRINIFYFIIYIIKSSYIFVLQNCCTSGYQIYILFSNILLLSMYFFCIYIFLSIGIFIYGNENDLK